MSALYGSTYPAPQIILGLSKNVLNLKCQKKLLGESEVLTASVMTTCQEVKLTQHREVITKEKPY